MNIQKNLFQIYVTEPGAASQDIQAGDAAVQSSQQDPSSQCSPGYRLSKYGGCIGQLRSQYNCNMLYLDRILQLVLSFVQILTNAPEILADMAGAKMHQDHTNVFVGVV